MLNLKTNKLVKVITLPYPTSILSNFNSLILSSPIDITSLDSGEIINP